MISQIDAHYVAAQIRLVRHADKRAILLLEGETDARIFDRFIDHSSCDIEIGFGKKNVVGAIDLLEEEGFFGVVGVIDADFDRLLNVQYPLENLCMTDCHDLDLTIFSSSALKRYLAEHADEELVKAAFMSDLEALRNAMVTGALMLGYCRLVSERDNLRLYFKDMRHDQFIGVDLTTDEGVLAQTLIDRSTTRCSADQLKRLIAIETRVDHDIYQIANGHDVSAVLGIALRKLLACRRTAQTWASEVEAGLRLAFDWEALTDTTLYRCLRDWESTNKKYRIFRQQPA
jgi:hypothetical protein